MVCATLIFILNEQDDSCFGMLHRPYELTNSPINRFENIDIFRTTWF